MNKLAKFKDYDIIDQIKNELSNCCQEGDCYSFFTNLSNGRYDHYFNYDNLIFHPSNKEIISDEEFNEIYKTKHGLAEASIVLYKSLGDLKKEEAIDKRLWTYLSLNSFRTHCVNQVRDGRNKGRKTIIKRVFFDGAGAGTSEGNYISRLWWYCENTILHEEKDEDKFKYTRFMLKDSQVTQDLMMRYEIASNKKLVHSFLDFISEKHVQDNHSIGKISKAISPIILNHLKSFDLDFYTKDEIKSLLTEFYAFAIKIKRI